MIIALIILAVVVVLLFVSNRGQWEAIDNLQTQVLELEEKLEQFPFVKADDDAESIL